MDEDDEPEAEPPLVLIVQAFERLERRAIRSAAALLHGGPRRKTGGRSDARMGVEHRDPLVLGHRREHGPGTRDDRLDAAPIANALRQERRALEGLSYPDT